MYGMGVAQNYEEAHSYFSKAAEAGNSEGRFNLGRSHHTLRCSAPIVLRSESCAIDTNCYPSLPFVRNFAVCLVEPKPKPQLIV